MKSVLIAPAIALSILTVLACGNPSTEQDSSSPSKDSITTLSTDRAANDSSVQEATAWIENNYNFSNHEYDNPLYSDRYKVYLRQGNDAILGDSASDQAFEAFKKEWSPLYDVDNAQYDRGGFDPPFVKLDKITFLRKDNDTSYFHIRAQSLGYDEEKPVEEDEFYEAQLKLIPSGIGFLIDEIIYKSID